MGEEGEPAEEVQLHDDDEREYMAYTDVNLLRSFINNMSNLVNTICDTIEAMASQITSWSHGWAPDYSPLPPQ